ncbi:MAG: hypothetical protein ABI345_04815 [Jatrophihabitans sp.]
MRDDELAPPHDPDALPRVLSLADARERGLSAATVNGRVARGTWRRVLPSTYFTGATFTDHDRLVAAVTYAGRDSALSGAAGLFAAGVRRVSMPERVLVIGPMSTYVTSSSWVQVRRSARPVTVPPWFRPRRVEPARAAADVALTMRRLDDVRALVARVVQDRHCTVAELGTELDCGPRRGSAHLRQALEEVGWGVASAPEARAMRILRRAGILGFEPNFELVLPDGSRRVVDFYWPALRACLEIDSVEWHFEQVDWSRTWDRHLDLSKFGYAVIHRPPSALKDEARFVRDVRDWLAGRESDLRRGIG